MPGGALHGPRLCGLLRHGHVAANGTELKRQNADRLWQQNSATVPEALRQGLEGILVRGIVHLLVSGKVWLHLKTYAAIQAV